VETRAPRPVAVLVMLGFCLTCVGLLVFLWLSFGGAVPFAGRPYEFHVEFNQAVELASQSDVRISGVSAPDSPARRSASTPPTRRGRSTPAQCCGPSRCSARPMSS
jgi:hypothetical protein